MRYYAHTREGMPEADWQPLEWHLKAVAETASDFAASFDAREWAYVLGLVHDVGKGSVAFQERLRGKPIQIDHSTAGTQLLDKRYPGLGGQLAYMVAGHHGGIPDGTNHSSAKAKRTPLRERLSKPIEPCDGFVQQLDLPDMGELMHSLPAFMGAAKPVDEKAFDLTFLYRMLYSCLVDADFLDTERFADPEKAKLRNRNPLSLHEMKEKLAETMASFDSDSTPVNAARSDIHQTCIDAASGVPGIYSLTVPTGGGKTLDSLDFALTHALANGQDRVIYAIPFTSIVEQTAGTFKSIFGPDAVIEHHSNYEFDDMEDDGAALAQRLCMENWDAPLIVTTNVQLFESIYSDKPSRCRKNHNLANSVIIFDEAQSLPDEYLKPCLAALEELSANYGTTVVLCTATQPALGAVWPFGSRPVEIVPEDRRYTALFDKRVQIGDLGTVSSGELAEKIAADEQVLCIVSTRGAASGLYDELVQLVDSKTVFHLSALMVPKHRASTLSEIRRRLETGLPCRVISTQLIEAGVDVDFPVVFREMAGIDSIKQAAGRCNREGKREVGYVFVFRCPEYAVRAASWLGRMRALGEETVDVLRGEAFGDKGVERFFKARYQVGDDVGGLDKLNIIGDFSSRQLLENLGLPFESCGEEFRFISDEGGTLFVPWDSEAEELLDTMRRGEIDIIQSRKIQQYCVNVPLYQLKALEERSAITGYPPYRVLETVDGELTNYSREKGLQIEEGGDSFLAI